MDRSRQTRLARRAFTLIEMLTVIAITAVLLTLVIIPVIQGFNLTRSAQGFADAQDKARLVIERITREIANSAGVLDNSGIAGTLAAIVPGRNGAPEIVMLEHVKLDIVKPAEGEPIRGPGGGLINPNTGKEDPTLETSKGQVVLPVTPGATIVRWFIGLRNPLDPRGYVNPFDGLLMPRQGTRDNLYVLYRAEVSPYVWDPTAVGGPRYVVNTKLFEVDPATVVPGDPYSGAPILNDPFFFYGNRDRTGAILTGGALLIKRTRVQNWLRRATVITEVSRYDMIQPVVNRANRQVVYEGNVPRLVALAQFRPGAVGAEPAEAMAAVRLGEESDAMERFAPDVFRTKFGGWSQFLIRTYPVGWDRLNPGSNEYLIGREDAASGGQWLVFLFDPDLNSNELTDGTAIFNRTAYDLAVKNNLTYPFSRALVTANLGVRSVRDRFGAYEVQTAAGKVVASFGIDEVGNSLIPPGPGGNLPTANTGLALTPVQVPFPPGPLTSPVYSPDNPAYEINSSFNKVWQVRPELRPNIHRFVDLRVLRQPDGTPSPLHPDPMLGFARAQIVPGSELVIGPDQQPGPHYGQPVRYERTTREPGPNQYKINYTDLPEPANYALLGFSNAEVSAFLALGGVYTPGNFLSAFFQPRFKAGYLQFHSDPNVPLPQGNITISYRFQFTRAGDTMTIDYDSRHLMGVLLTIRNYPGGTVPNPQSITVKGTANVRNILR